jgi:parallel beta-helix repeat protein
VGRGSRVWVIATLVVAAGLVAAAPSSAKNEKVVVCKHGCDYRTIQDAVDNTGKNATISVKPGKYVEGVIVKGHKHDGLTIKGTKKNPKKVILDGKNAHDDEGNLAQNAIEAINVDGMRALNLWVRNYAANGIFFRGTQKGECRDYLMKNLRASFNRAYGLFAFDCIGGRMTKSVGYGHGDSAFYVGATPFQKNPKTTSLDHLQAYENVLGYSGTNSKYVDIHHNDFFNNGIGVVPNTLDSEPYEPSGQSTIRDNNIFWNNFNYFAPGSPVQTVSSGLGTIEGLGTIQFPTGVGIFVLGSDGWTIENNQIFGNFKWGVALSSDPFNEGDQAISRNNQIVNNAMGRGGTDTNAFDFFVDGSGSGDCFAGNQSSTFAIYGSATQQSLYPTCPSPGPPASGTGTSAGEPGQFAALAGYVLTNPPEKQECSWTKHPHPPFEDFQPLEIGGVTCP